MTVISIVGLLLAIVIVLGGFVLWLVALIEALRISDAQWQAASENKVLWVVLIVVLGLLGAILYWFMARPKLQPVA